MSIASRLSASEEDVKLILRGLISSGALSLKNG